MHDRESIDWYNIFPNPTQCPPRQLHINFDCIRRAQQARYTRPEPTNTRRPSYLPSPRHDSPPPSSPPWHQSPARVSSPSSASRPPCLPGYWHFVPAHLVDVFGLLSEDLPRRLGLCIRVGTAYTCRIVAWKVFAVSQRTGCTQRSGGTDMLVTLRFD